MFYYNEETNSVTENCLSDNNPATVRMAHRRQRRAGSGDQAEGHGPPARNYRVRKSF